MFGRPGARENRRACVHFRNGTGICGNGDNCKFSHTIHDDAHRRNQEAVATGPFSVEGLRDQLAQRLTSGRLFSGHSDGLVHFWPGPKRLEMLWKGFLTPRGSDDPWPVDSQNQALNFINSGLHALNKEIIAPQFVRELGKTDGCGLRVIQEILDHEYSTDAGSQRGEVSFQRGLVPFVTMLTMQRMELASQHVDEANYGYSLIRTAHEQLFQLYLEHLEQIVNDHSIEDCVLSHASFLQNVDGRKYAPLCFTQVCLPFIRLLCLLGNKFKDFIYEEAFQEAVDKVDELVTQWVDETGPSDSPLDSTMCFKIMKGEIQRLHKMIQRGQRNMQTGVALEEKKRALQRANLNWSEPEPWDVIEVGIPGEAVLEDGSVGPRHDNDRRDIREIQLLPTTEECLSRESPLLPGNFPFHENAHWLPPGPERWVDTHFRLYREDFCSNIRASLQDLEHRLAETRGNLAAGRLRDADVDYNVYPIIETDMTLKHTESRGERDKVVVRSVTDCVLLCDFHSHP